MRRYTAVKSNVYAPLSTDLLSQNIVHSHMASHYRMMYSAKSRVDSSPPWNYKTRNFVSPDRMRKKTNKYTRPGKTTGAYRAELDPQSRSLVDRILYDTKQPPSAYKDEIIAQRQYKLGEPKRKEICDAENCRNKVPKDICTCDTIDDVPSLNMPLNKQRQVPQFRSANGQTWAKKGVSYNKRNSNHGKHIPPSQDVLRDSIPRQLGKPRVYHPTQSRRAVFQDDRVCVSSCSEGNVGDDEDGTPTSSCDDSNPSSRDNEKAKISSCDNVMENRKGDPCLCLTSIKEDKTELQGSEVSSRDSAYEGGEGMSSTENQRTSPDPHEDESKWLCKCLGIHYKEEGKGKNASQPTSRVASPLCGKSELYMKFLQDVTDDILLRGVYSNEALNRVFQEHIDRNAYNLDECYMKLMIEKLGEDLGIPSKNYRGTQVYDERIKEQPSISYEIQPNTEQNWPITSRELDSKVNNMMGSQFTTVSEVNIGISDMEYNWTKKQLPVEEQKIPSSLIVIEQNFSMSKKDIMDYLSDMDFDESMAEEIFHILAGKVNVGPEFTLQELQEIVKQ